MSLKEGGLILGIWLVIRGVKGLFMAIIPLLYWGTHCRRN